MSIEELAGRVLDALSAKGMILLLDDEEARSIVVGTLTGAPQKRRHDLPDRSPDFVFWIDHGKDGSTDVKCLPGALAMVPDWVGLAEWTLHNGSKALSQGEGLHYMHALRGIVEGAIDFAREESAAQGGPDLEAGGPK